MRVNIGEKSRGGAAATHCPGARQSALSLLVKLMIEALSRGQTGFPEDGGRAGQGPPPPSAAASC